MWASTFTRASHITYTVPLVTWRACCSHRNHGSCCRPPKEPGSSGEYTGEICSCFRLSRADGRKFAFLVAFFFKSWEQNAASVVFCLSGATFRKFSLCCRCFASSTPLIHFCPWSIASIPQKIQFLLQVSRLQNIASPVPFSVCHEETVGMDFFPSSYQKQRTV